MEALEICFQDADLAVVCKPAGMVVHPGAGRVGEAMTALLAEMMPLAGAAGDERPGIVHRLDKDTSGLMVVAKTDEAYGLLAAAMKRREIQRRYLALVWGHFRLPTGRIEAPLERAGDRVRRRVSPSGKFAATNFAVVQKLEKASLLEVKLETGRTHQIRVHMAHVGHPVVGDRVYGARTMAYAAAIGLHRPFLHAAALSFQHPLSGERISVERGLPPELQSALEAAGGRV
ncbi:MAG: RluA family pseudouridine synthase [Actinomycetota bacterium]